MLSKPVSDSAGHTLILLPTDLPVYAPLLHAQGSSISLSVLRSLTGASSNCLPNRANSFLLIAVAISTGLSWETRKAEERAVSSPIS